jgi:hypothetical protein
MFGAYLLYNLALTGSALKSPYAYWNSGTVGFSAAHSFAQGLMNTQTNLSLLVLVLHGWPVFVGLLLPLLPFVLGTTNRWDYFLLATVFSIIAAWSAYRGVFIMHGPRFWYEFVPYLMLLAARGVQRFVETLVAAGERLASRFPGRTIDVRPCAGLVATFCLAALLGYGFGGWVLARHELFPPMAYVPRHIGELRGFNSTDPRLLRTAEAEGLHHSVVFVRECGNWWCYGSVFWTNSLKLDGDLVWARDLGRESDARLMSSYPGRRAYIADYDRGTVVPLSLPGSSLLASP